MRRPLGQQRQQDKLQLGRAEPPPTRQSVAAYKAAAGAARTTPETTAAVAVLADCLDKLTQTALTAVMMI